ncbi:hypothetical protein FB45DRAFT_1123013 [Roridomyces roridus]|uniref:Uncharacterized protein n=1 Tax=Roridomyces roridus TaxID=1738132 RepID=A0AAD7B3J6_9AGAR|nr:hypothetical protein FB45DRAFT_1123013 [Roridomyces roridus]
MNPTEYWTQCIIGTVITPATVTFSLTTNNINPVIHQFTWSNVTVPAAVWYIVQATLTSNDTTFRSMAFRVADGCPTPVAANPSPDSTSPAASSRSSILTASSLSNTPSSKKVIQGATAGGVIGGLALVALAGVVYFKIRSTSTPRAAFLRKQRLQAHRWRELDHVDSWPEFTRTDQRRRSSTTMLSTLGSSVMSTNAVSTPSAAYPSGTSLEISSPAASPEYNLVDPEFIFPHLHS